ncbi:MAG TPA: VWA domain-containing protein [Steroidobacteraceae bacterium]|nr:VWA domain-containing protein [Steroidobacteraceae bacterium]
MNRVVRGSSLLIVSAIVAACAAQRDEGKATTDQQGPPQPQLPQQAQQPATEETDDSLAKAEAYDRAIQEITVTAAKRDSSRLQEMPMSISSVAPAAVANYSHAPPVYQHPTNTERYEHNDDNPVHLAAQQPVSTFSIDVDTGAYANVRRFLNEGRLPPQDAVRVEEMINYFDYRYAPPASRDVPFRVAAEVAPAPWNSQALLMKIGIKGFEVAASERPAANLVFLIDVSGSMQSPDKLPLLKNAFRLLTDQMTARDRVSRVVYAGSSGVVLEPTPGDQKHKIRAAIERLEAGGSTNGAEGIERAYQLAHAAQIKGGINRVVLATDGDFNVGVVNFEALVDMAERQRASGVAITTLGFGTGNYNDQLLERLADAGNGNYAYVDTLAEARKVLVTELSSTLFTIAKDVKIQVEFNPATVLEYRLIGYENRMLAREDFNNDKVDAGDIGAGHRITALYEVIPVGKPGLLDPLRYAPQLPVTEVPASAELAHVKLRYKKPDSDTSQLLEYPIAKGSVLAADKLSADFRFAASVAAFGQILRGGKYVGNFSYDDVAKLARGALAEDPEGYRREFLSLVKLAGAMTPAGAAQVSEVAQ